MIERLPTPWGLVRLGVAPDHPNIKAVSRAFEKIAAQPGFRFFGNVELGRDLTHEELTRIYDAVVYAVGAQTDRRLGIPGEDLSGSWAATELVAWYNGHPDYQGLSFDLNTERAVVVGAGNVALDVARMLALSPDELGPTDTTDAAIAAINDSPLREIVILARRGPAQAAFTTPELKEMGELADADVIVAAADLEDAVGTDTNSERNLEVLREYSTREPSRKRRRVVFRFCVSPVEIRGTDRVEEVEIVHNELVDGGARAVPTDRHETIPCGLVFRSVGYRGVALPGVPFDEDNGVIPNDRGRVERGLYVAGWIKRGPTGVIGTNKKDATETVELLLEDARAGLLSRESDERLEALLAERCEVVAYSGWEAIDLEERTRGEPHGRPRVKLCSWEELLASAREVVVKR
jgi:ferredoxin--NADP+ reductase